MRQWQVYIIVIMLAVAVMLSGCAGQVSPSPDADGSSTAASPAPVNEVVAPSLPPTAVMSESDVEALGIPGLSVVRYTEEEPNLRIEARYPQFGTDSIDKSTETMVMGRVDAFKKEASDYESEKALDVGFYLYRYSDKIVSVKYLVEEVAVHGTKKDTLITRTFDLAVQTSAALDDLFDTGAAYLNSLSELARQKLAELPGIRALATSALFLQGTEPKPENFQCYALEADGLLLFFQPGQIAPEPMGAPEIKISYQNLGGLWTFPGSLKPPEPSPTPTATPPPSPSPTQTGETTAPLPTDNYVEPEGTKYVAITFDDGPSSKTTGLLLDILKEYDAHATFFVLGHKVEANSALIARMEEEGHVVGNHTYDHKDLSKLGSDAIYDEVESTNKLVEKYAARPTLMRPPYGAKNDAVVKVCTDDEMSIVMWSIDPEDWRYRDADVVSKHILEKVRPGSIILLHDIHPTSVDAARIVLKELAARDYVFVTVPELIALSGGAVEAGKSYSKVKLG